MNYTTTLNTDARTSAYADMDEEPIELNFEAQPEEEETEEEFFDAVRMYAVRMYVGDQNEGR